MVHAGGLDDRVACWTSGPVDGKLSEQINGMKPKANGFGGGHEYVVDRRDLVGYEEGRYEIEAK